MKLNFSKEKTLSITAMFGPEENMIDAIKYNSKEVRNNAAFFCVTGENHDGHRYIKEALMNGATVIVGSQLKILKSWSDLYEKVTFLLVEDVKSTMASMSALFYNFPHDKLMSIAVTGTNGKTTVTSYIRSMLNTIGISTGSIGTEGIFNNTGKFAVPPTTPTTPEAPDLHGFYQNFCEQGLQAYVMEATSIALDQKRLEGITFDIGVHTNLTPEHLEYHGTFSAYKLAKLKLFHRVKQAVVNLDDPEMSEDIIATCKGSVLTYSLTSPQADVWVENIVPEEEGVSFDLHIQDQLLHIRAPIYGDYNISNLMAAICVCLHAGIPVKQILAAIPSVQGPEGRFQLLTDRADYKIILDYAHTPDALEKVLEAVKKMKHRRLIVMITGIGLRNPAKRPLMAKTIEGKADEIIVTVDHPGFFDRKQIVKDVLNGFSEPIGSHIHAALHREEGIHHALSLAEEGDLVLLTGIGFGGYQVIEGKKEYYSELEVIDSFYTASKKANG